MFLNYDKITTNWLMVFFTNFYDDFHKYIMNSRNVETKTKKKQQQQQGHETYVQNEI